MWYIAFREFKAAMRSSDDAFPVLDCRFCTRRGGGKFYLRESAREEEADTSRLPSKWIFQGLE